LTNAAQYTPPQGHIELSAASEGREIVIHVRDDGIGIAPDLLPRLFAPFVQGARHPARSEGGLGLGLTIVRTMVELHGGRVAARSRSPGRGSEMGDGRGAPRAVCSTRPCNRTAHSERAPSSRAAAGHNWTRPRREEACARLCARTP
jgi:hypothetical protein